MEQARVVLRSLELEGCAGVGAHVEGAHLDARDVEARGVSGPAWLAGEGGEATIEGWNVSDSELPQCQAGAQVFLGAIQWPGGQTFRHQSCVRALRRALSSRP
jgi:hypothetical protein